MPTDHAARILSVAALKASFVTLFECWTLPFRMKHDSIYTATWTARTANYGFLRTRTLIAELGCYQCKSASGAADPISFEETVNIQCITTSWCSSRLCWRMLGGIRGFIKMGPVSTPREHAWHFCENFSETSWFCGDCGPQIWQYSSRLRGTENKRRSHHFSSEGTQRGETSGCLRW